MWQGEVKAVFYCQPRRLTLSADRASQSPLRLTRAAFQPPAKDDRVSAPATAPLPGGWLLIRCFIIAEGLNTTTRRGEIGTSMPVLGLRPRRPPFSRTMNDPNEDSFPSRPSPSSR